MLGKWQYRLAGAVKKYPRLWSLTIKYVNRFNLLLPHERDYWGIRWLVDSTSDRAIIDVGANNGISALGFHKVAPTKKIISFEADPVFTPDLESVKRRIKDFEYKIVGAGESEAVLKAYKAFYKKVRLHGITSANKEYILDSIQRDFPELKSQIRIEPWEFRIEPLDKHDLKPELIKIDVEGYEISVMKGLVKTITEFRPTILIEYTPSTWGENSRFLENQGYVFYWYDYEADRFHFVTEAFTENLKKQHESDCLQFNIYAVHRDNAAVRSKIPLVH